MDASIVMNSNNNDDSKLHKFLVLLRILCHIAKVTCVFSSAQYDQE